MRLNRVGVYLLGFTMMFAVLANGAHDPWAATVVYLAALGLLVGVVLSSYWKQESPGLLLFSPLTLVAVIMTFGLSFLRSVQPWESFYEWCDWLAALAIFIVSLRLFEDDAAPRGLLYFVVPLLWIEFFLNLAQIHAKPSLLPLQRCTGSLVNANVAAGFFLFWFPVLFSAVYGGEDKKSWRWYFWLSGLVVCAANLFLTLSVSAWILVLLFLIFMVGPGRDRSNNALNSPKIKLLYVGAILLVIILIAVKWAEIYGWPSQNPKTTFTSRIIWWESGIKMFFDHPIVGIGIGNYASAYLAYKVGEGMHTFFPHSWPIGILAETGILGFGALSAFFMMWAAAVYKQRTAIQSRVPFITGLALSLLYSLINVNFEILANLLLLFVFAGLIVAPLEKTRLTMRLSSVVIFLALVVTAIPFIISPFLASQRVVEGERLLLENQSDRAVKYFSAAVQLDPRSWQARNGRARAAEAKYNQTKDVRFLHAAIQEKHNAIRLNKLSGALYWELGLLQIEAGAKAQGIAALEKGISLWPSNKELRAKLEAIK